MIRAAVVFVVVGLVAAAVLYDRVDQVDVATTAAPEPAIVTPSVTDPARLDGAWFCAVGSSSPGGFADHELQIANLGDDVAVANVNVLTSEGKGPTLRIDMNPLSTESVALSSISQADAAGAVVEIIGGTGAVSHRVTTAQGTAEGPCATHVSSSWYFASGRTTRDSRQYLALMNPFPEGVVYNVEFYRKAGRPRRPNDLQGGVIPPSSVEIIEVGEYIAREEAVAASVTTVRGRLVVERLQVLDGELGPSGAALELGVVAPSTSWVLPAGRVHDAGDDRVIVFNPSPDETATVNVELWPVNPTDRSFYGLTAIPRELLPGRFEIIDLKAEASRFQLPLPYELGVSVTSGNDVPIVVERWQFARSVNTNLIGAGGTEVESGSLTLDEDGNLVEEDQADPDADTDDPTSDTDDADAGADPAAEEGAENAQGPDLDGDGTPDPIPDAEAAATDVAAAAGLSQPTATAGIATSRGVEVESTRWILPWLATPDEDATVVVASSSQGANVEVRALVNGELLGPFSGSVAPFGRVIIPVDLPVSGAPLLVTADGPVAIEGQVVAPDTGLTVVPGVPTVDP